MSASKWPRRGANDGRVADVRFVEVELPAAVAPRLVIEMESGLRLIVADPMDVGKRSTEPLYPSPGYSA